MTEDKEEKMEKVAGTKIDDKESIFISETTLRKIISDYIYRRPRYKSKMAWESKFSSLRIVVDLEERPNTQESLGYVLEEEV